MRELFRRRPTFNPVGYDPAAPVSEMPDDRFSTCPRCKELNYGKEFEEALEVCLKCGHHTRLTGRERLDAHLDAGSIIEFHESPRFPQIDKSPPGASPGVRPAASLRAAGSLS